LFAHLILPVAFNVLSLCSVTKKVVPAAAPKAVVCTNKAEPEAYSSKQLPIEDIDLDRDNPQLVSYYAKDIYSYLRQLEVFVSFYKCIMCN
jgi:hypothetical protein